MTYRIRPGVKAFIVHQGKVLVVQEKVIDGPEVKICYDVPGGGMEEGETIHQTVIREVFEEVGLKIQVERPVGCWEHLYVHPVAAGQQETHIVCLGFQCSVQGGLELDLFSNPVKDENIVEAVWLSPQEIIEKKLFHNADMVESLKNVSF